MDLPSLRILMVTDFFYPNCGGVENHVFQLSQCLLDHGHKVVVLTHAYGDRTGVRYLTNGLKVYHIPRRAFYASVTLPTLFGTFRLFRHILIREQINLVHAHQAFSVLGNEALLHARTMGFRVVFTDHSLFGFADYASILHNKLLKWILSDVHHVICVSHTSKENTVLRACLAPSLVSVIPNAVDMPKFRPFPRPKSAPNSVCVVILNRLVYRKGIDLQLIMIPKLCKKYPNLRFVIGGDGPKGPALAAMLEMHGLQDRVEMVGEVPHERVRSFLVQGDIFLNTSLTEAFCMAIVEAACAGLLVVSTNVGGVPEVLPHDICVLAEPEPNALLAAMDVAMSRYKDVDRQKQHERVSHMYDWDRIATRTEAVYKCVLAGDAWNDFLGRLRRLRACGPVFGLLAICFAVLDTMWLRVIEWMDPAWKVDIAPTLSARHVASWHQKGSALTTSTAAAARGAECDVSVLRCI